MENDIQTDVKTDVKIEDCKSKFMVVAWAELDLLRNSLEQAMDGCWEVVTIEQLQKLESVAHGLEHLMSREAKAACFQTATDTEAADDR
jgi:hypothetical protein